MCMTMCVCVCVMCVRPTPQAIDMNQDGYLCEWLKFRNLLAELQPSGQGDFHLFANDDETFCINASLTARVCVYVCVCMCGCVCACILLMVKRSTSTHR